VLVTNWISCELLAFLLMSLSLLLWRTRDAAVVNAKAERWDRNWLLNRRRLMLLIIWCAMVPVDSGAAPRVGWR
jgi:hypothetical protein